MKQSTALATGISQRMGSHRLLLASVVVLALAMIALVGASLLADLAPAATGPIVTAPIRW